MIENVLITGASSGLGAALALAFAQGGTTLFLSGRDEERLKSVAKEAEECGARVVTKTLDVTDAAAMEAWVRECNEAAALDLVIANAGISAGTGGGEETPEQAAAIFATNLGGVLNTVQPVAALMKKRGFGQIAIMSSLAGFRGLAGAPSYCASKAAVRVYGESLRDELAAYGVIVSVICPGFVETPMTGKNGFPMPFLMKPDKAAQIMKRGLEKGAARIAFPWRLSALVWLIAALPPSLTEKILTRLP
ncbi:MAG TPA: short-chain dehydrogenase, partial [Rhodospirillaceae bacterium]|nr:short-chain dehydrogenase [Rhodospirillaceae bacterium]